MTHVLSEGGFPESLYSAGGGARQINEGQEAVSPLHHLDGYVDTQEEATNARELIFKPIPVSCTSDGPASG